MGITYIARGVKFQYQNQEYQILRQVESEVWQIEAKDTGRISELSDQELKEMLLSNEIQLFEGGLGGASLKVDPISPLEISDKEWTDLKVKRSLVKEIEHIPSSEAKVAKVLQSLKRKYPNLEKFPSSRTLLRWKKSYLEAGGDIRSLIPRHWKKGNRNPRFDSRVLEFVRVAIDDRYLSLERPNVESLINGIKAEINRYNKLQPDPIKLTQLPSRTLVQRMIGEVPEFDRVAARYGWSAARKKFRLSFGGTKLQRPLEQGQIDHSPLDFFVLDDATLLPLGRPVLTVLICSWSRVVLGIALGFEPPSYLSVSICLKHACLPKASLREQFPEIENEWTPYGVVSELVVDNGLEFLGNSLEHACQYLGTDIIQSPRKEPWFKGKVERFIGTFNKSFSHDKPGTTFNNIFEKADYDPQKHAVVRYSVLKMLVIKWIVDVYHQKPHSSLNAKPVDVWNNSIRSEEIPVPAKPKELDAMLSRSDERTLSQTGIRLDHLDYNSSELGLIRRNFGEKLDVKIRIDDSDIGSISVICPKTGEIVKAKANNFEYANGKSRYMHKIIRKYAKQEINDDSLDGWIEAEAQIRDIIANEVKYKGSHAIRRARYKEGTINMQKLESANSARTHIKSQKKDKKNIDSKQSRSKNVRLTPTKFPVSYKRDRKNETE